MLRVVLMTVSADRAAAVGGPATVEYATIDVEAPEVDAFLRMKMPSLTERSIIAVEWRDRS